MKWYDPLKATGPFGWVSWIISAFNKNDSVFNKIGDGLGSIFNKYTGAGPTGADVYANDFSAAEAQKARDWEEEMSNTSIQRQVADMRKAGLNTALMYGGAGSSGASTPSSPSPSSVAPQSQGLGDILGSIMDMALLKAQIANINADTDEKKAGAEQRRVDTERTKALTPLEMQDIVSQIDLRASEMSKYEAEVAVDYANLALLESDVKVRDEFNSLNLELQKANLAKSDAERNEILQRTENLKRDFAISFAQEAAVKAQAGMLSQQTKNLLVENDILKWNEKASQYEAGLTEYNYDHADGNRIWDRIATGASVLRDAGIAVGAVVGGAVKGAAKGVSETITNTSQQVFNSKGKLVKTVVTNQNRNK